MKKFKSLNSKQKTGIILGAVALVSISYAAYVIPNGTGSQNFDGVICSNQSSKDCYGSCVWTEQYGCTEKCKLVQIDGTCPEGCINGTMTGECGIIPKGDEPEPELTFDPWKTHRINETLLSGKWDDLMDKLNELSSIMDWTVPNGAIMAFDSKDGCPAGWEEWHNSDGKFLMGGDTDQIGDVGGRSKMKLTTNELPPHDHGIYYRDNWNVGDNGDKYPPVLEDIGYFNNHPTENVKTKKSTIEGKGEEFSILNPYYKIIYCKKTDKNIEISEGECDNTQIKGCASGSHYVDGSHTGNKFQDTWTCRGNNGSSDAYCIKCKQSGFNSKGGEIIINAKGTKEQFCYQKGECYSKAGTFKDWDSVINECKGGEYFLNSRYEIDNGGVTRQCKGMGPNLNVNEKNSEYCLLCYYDTPNLVYDTRRKLRKCQQGTASVGEEGFTFDNVLGVFARKEINGSWRWAPKDDSALIYKNETPQQPYNPYG